MTHTQQSIEGGNFLVFSTSGEIKQNYRVLVFNMFLGNYQHLSFSSTSCLLSAIIIVGCGDSVNEALLSHRKKKKNIILT